MNRFVFPLVSPSLLRNKQIMQVSRLKAPSMVVTTFTEL